MTSACSSLFENDNMSWTMTRMTTMKRHSQLPITYTRNWRTPTSGGELRLPFTWLEASSSHRETSSSNTPLTKGNSIPTQIQSQFLMLPAEVRDQIYSEFFNTTIQDATDLSLLLACRQTYGGARWLALSLPTWHLDFVGGTDFWLGKPIGTRLHKLRVLNQSKLSALRSFSTSMMNPSRKLFPLHRGFAVKPFLHITTLTFTNVGTCYELLIAALDLRCTIMHNEGYIPSRNVQTGIPQPTAPQVIAEGLLDTFRIILSLERLLLVVRKQKCYGKTDGYCESRFVRLRIKMYDRLLWYEKILQELGRKGSDQAFMVEQCWEKQGCAGKGFVFKDRKVTFAMRQA